MGSALKLSVLDQSPIHDGGPATQAPLNTTRLAQACERFGYHRYWVAEHHDIAGYAGTCPEILIGHIASATKRIRVDSGGIMLTHYSPFKVAEVFHMLQSLHPDRIDLGVGRAPGSDGRTAVALAFPGEPATAEVYARQVYDLQCFLGDAVPDQHPFEGLRAVPQTADAPPLWLLGSGAGSAEFAGQMGAGFALALFIGTHERTPAIIEKYRAAFEPTAQRPAPQALVTVAVICADDADAALRIASTHRYWKVQAFRHGKRIPLLPPDECLRLKDALSPQDQDYYAETLATNMIVGSPAECRTGIEALAGDYGVDEIMVVNVCYHFGDRLRSYELLSREFSLAADSAAPSVHDLPTTRMRRETGY